MALTIDELSAMTERTFLPLIADNVFTSNPVMARLWMRGPKEQGGTEIRVPLMYSKVGAAGAIRGFDTMNIDADDQFTAADFEWKEYYAAIVISRREMLRNNGAAAQINHVSAKSQAAEMTLRDIMGTGMFSDGASNTDLIDGLVGVTAAATYPSGGGGIAHAAETWWAPGTVSVDIGDTAAIAFSSIQTSVGNLTEQPNSPTLMVTTQTGLDTFMGHLDEKQRFHDSTMASLGFESVMFRRIPIVVDSHVAAASWFILNENFLQLISHSEENFIFEPFRRAFNQKVMVAYIFWTGNLVCNNRRFQGLDTDFAN